MGEREELRAAGALSGAAVALAGAGLLGAHFPSAVALFHRQPDAMDRRSSGRTWG